MRMAVNVMPRCLLALALFKIHQVKGTSSNFMYMLKLIDEDRIAWVDTHNYFRRLVAGPEAADMRLMTWNTELEELASTVVKTCSFHHTSNENLVTSEFSPVGENLYAGGEYVFNQMMTTDGITKQWFDELAFYNYSSATCESGKECGHYTQVIWAKTYKVGCAIARCSNIEGGNTPFLVSCNYGPAGNAYYEGGIPVKPYTAGDPCSECDTNDTCTDQLCSNEVRDSNVTVTQATVTSSTSMSTNSVVSETVTASQATVSSSTAEIVSGTTEGTTKSAGNETATVQATTTTPSAILVSASTGDGTSGLVNSDDVTTTPGILVWGSTPPNELLVSGSTDAGTTAPTTRSDVSTTRGILVWGSTPGGISGSTSASTESESSITLLDSNTASLTGSAKISSTFSTATINFTDSPDISTNHENLTWAMSSTTIDIVVSDSSASSEGTAGDCSNGRCGDTTTSGNDAIPIALFRKHLLFGSIIVVAFLIL